MDKRLNGIEIINMVRLLAELRACGLSEEQLGFLKESADLDKTQVSDILYRAEEMYEYIKDLIKEGYWVTKLPISDEEILKREEVQIICDIPIEYIGDHTNEMNETMDELILSNKGSLGYNEGLIYKPIIKGIPFKVYADLDPELLKEIKEESSEEEYEEGIEEIECTYQVKLYNVYDDIEVIDDNLTMNEARLVCARVLKRVKNEGYPISILTRGMRWEIEEPENIGLVPEGCGVLAIKEDKQK